MAIYIQMASNLNSTSLVGVEKSLDEIGEDVDEIQKDPDELPEEARKIEKSEPLSGVCRISKPDGGSQKSNRNSRACSRKSSGSGAPINESMM